jgi:hypothetical protein
LQLYEKEISKKKILKIQKDLQKVTQIQNGFQGALGVNSLRRHPMLESQKIKIKT